jgi:hypothetical protein
MKRAFTVGAIFLLLFCFTTRAFPWGSATHAYILDKIMRKAGPPRLMYGAMAPDVFNYFAFIMPPNSYPPTLPGDLYTTTHESFLKLWDAAQSRNEKPTAYGFVSHNNIWGIDSTAHVHSLTLDYGSGFVIQKAEMLIGVLDSYGVWASLNLHPLDPLKPEDHAKCLAICHELVEAAVDLLIKNLDPNIGNRLVDSARSSDKKFLNLLIAAYADNVVTPEIIAINEAYFRSITLSLGNSLKLKAPDDLNSMAAQMAGMAAIAYGITIDPSQVAGILQITEYVCTDPMFGPNCFMEIFATIEFVKQQLAVYNISY